MTRVSKSDPEVTTLLSGIAMGESARWHEGRFWFSDWVAGEILAVDPDGTADVVARSTSFPFCFDWLADETMVVTGAKGLERFAPGEPGETGSLIPLVDMTSLIEGGWNE